MMPTVERPFEAAMPAFVPAFRHSPSVSEGADSSHVRLSLFVRCLCSGSPSCQRAIHVDVVEHRKAEFIGASVCVLPFIENNCD
jgi:hypothetical protein